MQPFFDGHNDTLTNLEERGGPHTFFEHGATGHLDLPRARAAGMIGGFFAIYTDALPGTPNIYDHATITDEGYDVPLSEAIPHDHAKTYTDGIIEMLYELENMSDGQLGVVRSRADLERQREGGVFSVVLHIEGAACIGPDLAELETYYERGLRSLGPVWSRPNSFGHGVPFRYPHSPDTGPGLTDAGQDLIRACNRLGIMIDLAHLNERGFWDVAAITAAPLVDTHTAAHAICPSTRNLTDAQIDAIAESGGVIGVVFSGSFTHPSGKRANATTLDETIIPHMVYLVERMGIEHVAFGSDFDGTTLPTEMTDVTVMPRLIEKLRAVGFDDAALEQIAWRNWFRVLGETWGG